MPNGNDIDRQWDLIVVGGGAAGFFAAITCAENLGEGCRVLILEKTANVLGKVKISGGGRCNVTHACYDAKHLAEHYPRGSKSLIGPFHRWGVADTVEWFSKRGVVLKTEADGRMFPVTDNSETVIDCLTKSASDAGVFVRKMTAVKSIIAGDGARFQVTTEQGETIPTKSLLIASGGTRLAAGARLAKSLGHELMPDVPSLFAFNITDKRIEDLPGISVLDAEITVNGMKLCARGPLLITHHGLSGPSILKLSAWGARELHASDYQFTISINWLPEKDVERSFLTTRQSWSKRRVRGRSPFENFPKRLWEKLCIAADVDEDCTWSHLSKKSSQLLIAELTAGKYRVSGKSINKDEFVTCGGVCLTNVNLKTMQSRIQPGLYFAGEVLDIDGITGGFNFQNAWTSGFLAGCAAAGV